MAFLKGGKTNGAQNKNGNVLLTTTIRDFSGGLNVVDTDLNMKPKYAKTLDNIERGIDGTLSVRQGTKLFADVSTYSADTSAIVNTYYFNGYVISVQASGRISKTDGAGASTLLSTAWPSATYASFTVFNSELILCNGQNKPQIIEGNPNKPNYMVCLPLIDLGSGSNVNTPIGTVCISHAQYTIIAGIPTAPSTIYISARGTSGTYLGDPPPNDAVALDLGPRISLGSSSITGMVSYRDKLLITFERGVLPINLGIYTGSPTAVHTPTDDGFIEEFGCLSHRSLISVGDDTFFCDNIGVNSIERVVLYNTLRPERISELIDPLITSLIQPLSPTQIGQYVFAMYDMRHRRYTLFVPTLDSLGNITETIGFSYTNLPQLKIEAWSRLRGWIWSSACRTSLQNIVFSNKSKLYVYDFDNITGNADFVGDTAVNADGTGVAIAFDWELPWADFNKRMNVKETAYVSLDTTGTSQFTIAMYTDNIRNDSLGVDAPALKTDFVGGGSGAYGSQLYGPSQYGAGRPTGDERLFAWPAKFKISKFRIQGLTKLPLRIISMTVGYKRGSIRR